MKNWILWLTGRRLIALMVLLAAATLVAILSAVTQYGQQSANPLPEVVQTGWSKRLVEELLAQQFNHRLLLWQGPPLVLSSAQRHDSYQRLWKTWFEQQRFSPSTVTILLADPALRQQLGLDPSFIRPLLAQQWSQNYALAVLQRHGINPQQKPVLWAPLITPLKPAKNAAILQQFVPRPLLLPNLY